MCVSIQQLKLRATYIGHICITLIVEIFVVSSIFPNPSVLLRCWLGGRKDIGPVKNWVVWCWHGYLSGAMYVQTCIWPSWCHCHSLSLASVKSRLVLPFWYRLTQVVLDKGPLNVCVCVCVCVCVFPKVSWVRKVWNSMVTQGWFFDM